MVKEYLQKSQENKTVGKLKVKPDPVEWFGLSESRTCYGVAHQSAHRNTVIKELIDAPVDLVDLDYRMGKTKYADRYIVIETALNLSEEDLKKVPWNLTVTTTKLEGRTGFKQYKFLVEEQSVQKA